MFLLIPRVASFVHTERSIVIECVIAFQLRGITHLHNVIHFVEEVGTGGLLKIAWTKLSSELYLYHTHTTPFHHHTDTSTLQLYTTMNQQ